MSSKHNTQPKVIYLVETEELERVITRAVTDAMERYTSITGIQAQAVNDNDLMTREEVSEYLGVTAATLHNWSKRGYLEPIHIGRLVRYRRADVEALARTNNKQ